MQAVIATRHLFMSLPLMPTSRASACLACAAGVCSAVHALGLFSDNFIMAEGWVGHPASLPYAVQLVGACGDGMSRATFELLCHESCHHANVRTGNRPAPAQHTEHIICCRSDADHSRYEQAVCSLASFLTLMLVCTRAAEAAGSLAKPQKTQVSS